MSDESRARGRDGGRLGNGCGADLDGEGVCEVDGYDRFRAVGRSGDNSSDAGRGGGGMGIKMAPTG